ncbi:tetratricopeptide repeat protein [Patescibacteria group bacterium]|nr:tetratricopeptide repeat protein [Patescibacteria group bacterium]
MLSKKSIIILSSVIFIVVIATGGFYVYKKGYLNGAPQVSPGSILEPEKLLTFEIKNKNLTLDQANLFQDRFGETKESLQKNPDDFNQWLYLGVLKKGVGDYEGSRDVFLYAGQIRPQSSTPFANLADLYAYFLNEPQKAEAAIKKAIANDPNDYNFYISLADIYQYKFPNGGALYEQTMLEALQKFPDNPNLVSNLAAYYRQTNQVDKAIEYYEKLVRLAPGNETAKQDLEELRNK